MPFFQNSFVSISQPKFYAAIWLKFATKKLTGGKLQVAAIKDASQSNQGSGSTSGRLLHLRLTDGHGFLTAIEYRSVPSLSVDIPPGTKVDTKDSWF